MTGDGSEPDTFEEIAEDLRPGPIDMTWVILLMAVSIPACYIVKLIRWLIPDRDRL